MKDLMMGRKSTVKYFYADTALLSSVWNSFHWNYSDLNFVYNID